ncbi:Ig-like domain-containing protein, partial [Bacillus cereus]|nr:Ig-like domain-containing protein [Bacillus cereus]
KDQQVAQQKDSTVLQIPNALKVKNDQQGNLMAEQQIIGQYFVTANDNKMKIVFNDSVKDSKGVKGKIKFDTVFNPDLKPGIKAVPLTFPLGTVAKTISVPVQVDNPTSPTINSDDAKQTTKEQKNGDAQQPTEQPKDGETQQKPAEQPKDGNTQQPAKQPKNGNPQQPTEQPKDGGTQQPTENPGDNTTGQPVENPDPSPKQIKENILTSVKLTDKD